MDPSDYEIRFSIKRRDIANARELTGFPLIQFEVRFSLAKTFTTDRANDPPTPAIDDLRLRFRFE